jgi:large subunit ribosomal protein L32
VRDVLEPTLITGYPDGQLSPPYFSMSKSGTPPDLGDAVMAVPKRRMSRSNTRSRRSQWKTEAVGLVGVTVAGQQHKVPRRLLKAARLGLINLDKR